MDAAREGEGGARRAEHIASAHDDDDDGFDVNEGDDTLTLLYYSMIPFLMNFQRSKQETGAA